MCTNSYLFILLSCLIHGMQSNGMYLLHSYFIARIAKGWALWKTAEHLPTIYFIADILDVLDSRNRTEHNTTFAVRAISLFTWLRCLVHGTERYTLSLLVACSLFSCPSHPHSVPSQLFPPPRDQGRGKTWIVFPTFIHYFTATLFDTRRP